MIGINIKDTIDARADFAGATAKQIDNARTRALRKMRKKIETLILRQVSKKNNIPQKALGDRVFSNNVQPGDELMRVWIGTWHISPFSIGAPKQTKSGVRVGRKNYPGAFMQKIYSATEKVWIRLHSPKYSPELYPTKHRPGDRGLGGNRGRFPVVRAAIPIDATVRDVIQSNEAFLAGEFEKLMAQELNYEINVKGAR